MAALQVEQYEAAAALIASGARLDSGEALGRAFLFFHFLLLQRIIGTLNPRP